MKSKFLTAAALACAISLAAPGIASAQGTSSVSASGTTTFCAINGVEVSCDNTDRPRFDVPSVDVPDFGVPGLDVLGFDLPDSDVPIVGMPDFGIPSFDVPDFGVPSFDVRDFGRDVERPSFVSPARPATGSSSSVTVTASARAVSTGTSTTTSTLCTVNGVEVPCDTGTSAFARSAFDFSMFGR